MLAKRFFYVSMGILALTVAYHLGADSVTAQSGAECPPILQWNQGYPRGWVNLQSGAFGITTSQGYGTAQAPLGTRYMSVDQNIFDICNGNGYVYAYLADGTAYAARVIDGSPLTLDAWQGGTHTECPISPTPTKSTSWGEVKGKTGR